MSKHSHSNDFIDIKGFLDQYINRWYWFLISLVICGIGAYVYVKKYPRESQIQASILVTQDDGTAAMLNGLGGLFGADPYVQDEIFVITSHSVLKTVAQNLGLNKIHYVKTGLLSKKLEYPEYPVDVFAAPQLVDTLAATVNFKIKVTDGGQKAYIKAKVKRNVIFEEEDLKLPATINTEYGQFTITTTDTYPKNEDVTTWIYFTGFDSAAEDLNELVGAYIASKKSNVIELELQTTNDDMGCDLLNEIMSVYNQRGIEERNIRATKTANFIAERLDMISDALNSAETQIEKYKEGNRIIDVTTEATVNTKLKTETESRLVGLRTQDEILNMTLNFLSQSDNKYELMPVTAENMGGVSSAVTAYNDLILRRMNILNGAKPDNREVRNLEKQIDALRDNILVALDRSIKAVNVEIKDIQKQANLAISKLGNVPTQEREYINLKRQQEVKQQLYLFLLQRSEETAMLIANAIPKGQIIDSAYVLRDPVGMSRVMIAILAFFVALFIPVFIIYIRGFLRNRIDGRADLEKQTELPILGEMCIDKSGNTLVVTHESTSSAAELSRMIRTNLQFVLGNPGDKVVMVTSSMSGEGKSFISINVAASLALLGRKVALVGMDIRKPQLANYLNIPETPGLTQYLSNSQIPLADIIRPYDEVPGLSIIVSGPIPPNPGELMTSPRIKELIDDLRRQFDYIIVDTAPIGMVSDTFNLSKYVDATIFVVRDKVTRLEDIRFLNIVAEEGRLKRTNIVINGTSRKKGYGYGYSDKEKQK